MLKQILFTAAACASATVPVLAHDGPRVWIGNAAGTILTYAADDDLEPSIYSESQVFNADLLPFFGVYTTEFPGYEIRRDGGNVSAPARFGFKIAGPLLVLDSAANRLLTTQEKFAPLSQPVPQLSVSIGSTIRNTSAGVVNGVSFFDFSSIGDHAHLAYTLLGDGSNASAASPDGVYVLPLQLTGDTLAASDWYFLVLNKNAAAQQMQARMLAQTMADALPGDANFSGQVNISDFALLASNFGQSGKWWKNGDFNFDGSVTIVDFALLAANFNRTSPRAAVPEPAAGGCIALFALAPRRRRRNDQTFIRPPVGAARV